MGKTRLFVWTVSLAVLIVSSCPAVFAASGRTFAHLSAPELDQLSTVTLAYYQCVADKAATRIEPGAQSPERIVEASFPYIRIARQQCRIRLLNVEKLLYGFDVNPEFITNYVNTLRDDVQYFALDSLLQKAAVGKQGESGNKAAENNAPSAVRRSLGLGLLGPSLTEGDADR